jgi:hypothetical protein
MLFVPSLIQLALYSLQPVSSYVNDYGQRIEGKMPEIKDMRFFGDAIIIPYDHDRTIVSVALSFEGFYIKPDGETARFVALGCVIDFVLLNKERERQDFPPLLDISIPPFKDALNLCVSAARGHLLPRFHGSLWPNFILPFIGMEAFRQSLKKRDLDAQRSESITHPKSDSTAGLAGETIKPSDDLM